MQENIQKLRIQVKQLTDAYPKNYASMIFKNTSYSNIKSAIIEFSKDKLSSNCYSFKTKIYWFLNNITEFPKCKVCGKLLIGKNIKNIRDGYDSHFCSIKCKYVQTKQSIKESMLKKYNVENPFQLKSVKQKLAENLQYKLEAERKTKLERYGNQHYNNRKQALATLQKNGIKIFNPEKSKQTKLNKYNDPYYNNSLKNIETKRLHHSFNTSQLEETCYKILSKKYGADDIIRQFRSDEYPFNCDFYVKSKNLYIEFQGSWTHGFHPFNNNDATDIKTLNLWKEKAKTSEFYENAIQTWTVRDVNKRETAKKNNINYLEIWDINLLI